MTTQSFKQTLSTFLAYQRQLQCVFLDNSVNMHFPSDRHIMHESLAFKKLVVASEIEASICLGRSHLATRPRFFLAVVEEVEVYSKVVPGVVMSVVAPRVAFCMEWDS